MPPTSSSFHLDYIGALRAVPSASLFLDLELTIVEVTDTYLIATSTKRNDIIGKTFFNIFSENLSEHSKTFLDALRASLLKVIECGKPDNLSGQKYAFKSSPKLTDHTDLHSWSVKNSPIFDDNCKISLIIHSIEEVTAVALQSRNFENKENRDSSYSSLVYSPHLVGENEPASNVHEHVSPETKLAEKEAERGDSELKPVGPQADKLQPLVLIVEDNSDVRDFLQLLLAADYRTICACNGKDGILSARNYSPDLIIADVMMPEMSGEEMVRQLRSEVGLEDIPVIILTARVEEDFRIRMLEYGVQDFLTKPFAPKELLARSSRIIVERRNAKDNLKNSEERYRNLVEATTSLVWTTNERGEVRDAQPSWQHYTGQDEKAIVGWGWLNAFHPEDQERFRQAWLGSIAFAGLFRIEGKIWSRKHSMYRFFVARGISLRNGDGSIREWVGSIRDIHERTTMVERLKHSVHEKETLLKEIHHRVKNNLQIISSLLQLQSMRVEGEQFRRLLEESQNRIRAMALIHEKLYQSQTLSKVDFGDYLKLLVQELFINLLVDPGRIALELEIDNVELEVSRAIPCGLLINELLSNSLKHAFPNGKHGRIKVILKNIATAVVYLSLEDNGEGLAEHIDPKHPTSLGLEIVNTLGRQLGAQINYTRKKGLHWSIQFAATSAEDIRISSLNSQISETSIQ